MFLPKPVFLSLVMRAGNLAGFFLGILVLCAPPAAAQEWHVRPSLIEAVQLYSDGENSQALKLLEALSVEDPEDDAVWYYTALARARRGDGEAALEAMRKAVALDSGNFWYRIKLARILSAQEDPMECIDCYESIMKDFPDRDEAAYELLEVYLQQKELDKALALMDKIELERGPSEEIAKTRYDIYSARGKQDEGAALLEKFAEEYSSPSILSTLGDYYLSDYSDSLAFARYSEALSLDSSYVPAILGMSEYYRHQRSYPDYFRTLEPFFSSKDITAHSKSLYIGNLPRSIDPKILQIHREGFDNMVNSAVESSPADSSLLVAAGTYFYATKREEKAGEFFRLNADSFPESLSQTATYIQYLSLREDWPALRDRSVDAFNRFRELAFLDYANMANYQLEDYDAIIGNCQYLISNFPQQKDVMLSAWSMMGDAWHSKGNSKEAYRAYEKALKIDPSYAPVLNNYAYYLCLEGKKLKKAYTMSKKTVEANPDNATYLDTFAWILHLMGRDLEAKPFFKHAMLYGGKDSAVILRHYATVLEALGEAETARVYRNQAARLGPEKE